MHCALDAEHDDRASGILAVLRHPDRNPRTVAGHADANAPDAGRRWDLDALGERPAIVVPQIDVRGRLAGIADDQDLSAERERVTKRRPSCSVGREALHAGRSQRASEVGPPEDQHGRVLSHREVCEVEATV